MAPTPIPTVTTVSRRLGPSLPAIFWVMRWGVYGRPRTLRPRAQVASGVADPTAAITLAQSYSPYGEVTTHVGSFNTNYGYAGEWVDGTGLINLRAQYYNPMNGQFITRDPFAGIYTLPSTLNGYSYANNNPIRYFDPSGKLITELLVTALVGALIGGGIDLVVQLSSNGWKLDCVDWKDVGIAAGAGAVAGLVGFITFGAMTAVLGTGLFAEIAAGAVSGVFAGQYVRMTPAALSGKEQDAKNALFNRNNY